MANTPLGYPYPVGTDRLADGDNVIQALAEKVDSSLGVAAAGTLGINITALNTVVTVAVTLPAGRFTAGPMAVVGLFTSASPNDFGIQVIATTASSIDIRARRYSGSVPYTLNVMWLAIQV